MRQGELQGGREARARMLTQALWLVSISVAFGLRPGENDHAGST